jgi:hypothetical protein
MDAVSTPLVGGLLVLTLIAWPLIGASQPRTSSEERFFRIDWQIEQSGERPVIAGTIRNGYADPIQRVQVLVQVLDSAGQITHEVLGTTASVAPGARGSFRVPLPAAGARYVVTVQAFEFGAVQSP